jgi:hypothetical protein
MSGQQIGSAIGYVVGAYFGGPVGAAIGSAIGGYIGGVIDPTQINGPHIGEGQSQTAEDGVPIPWILGKAPCVGNICMAGPRYEVKQTEGGKGSTTETNTFEAHQSFAILICESCELRDSTIIGIQMVRCNGKIVYDVRPGSTMLAESAKWKEKVEFYFGAEDQMPDPTMEAIFGVGDTPYMRGYCYAVFRDFNRSEFGDAIPQFEWVVVSEGETPAFEAGFGPGRLSAFRDEHWPLEDDESDYEYTGYIGTTELGGGAESFTADTIAEIISYFTNFDYSSVGGGSRAPVNYLGYSATTGTGTTAGIGLDVGVVGIDATTAQPSVVDYTALVLVYNDFIPTGQHDSIVFTGYCGLQPGDAEMNKRGAIAKHFDADPGGQYGLFQNCSPNGYLYGLYPLCIRVTRKRIKPLAAPATWTPVPDLPNLYIDEDGAIRHGQNYGDEQAGTFKVLQASHTPGGTPSLYDKYEVGPALINTDPNYSVQAFWEAEYALAVARGDMQAGLVYGSNYPVTRTSAWPYAAPDISELDSATLTLATIVQRINRRGGLTDADIDVTELTDQVIGYPIAQQYNAADCIRPLASCYFFKGTEYDAKIHFHKDGSDALIVVDPDDFIIGSEEVDEDKRGQAKEYPRLITGKYIAPSLDFAIGTTKAERRSPDVRAIGEQTLQIPVCMDDDEAQQATDKAMKVLWAKQQGKRKFSVPYATESLAYLQMVPCVPFGLDGKRYVVDQLTINDGQLDIEASYDRQSAFTSNVTAIPRLPPTPPVSTIFGPTIVAIMQLPQLRAGETPPGIYFGACGVLANWPGCQILISFDGGENYQLGPKITVASVIGNLTADVAADGSNSEPILVAINNGELVNVTDAQFDSGANGFAMVDADDVWEVGRFKTQDELSPLNYSVTDVTRGDLLTTPVDHVTGQQFVMLANAVFWPIDPAFAGQTLYIKPVTFGTDPALTEVYTVVYNPDLDVIVDGGGD